MYKYSITNTVYNVKHFQTHFHSHFPRRSRVQYEKGSAAAITSAEALSYTNTAMAFRCLCPIVFIILYGNFLLATQEVTRPR